jgi:NADP-dependent aldehyde dehydrogenase
MPLTGKLLIGAGELSGTAGYLSAVDPATGLAIEPAFSLADTGDVAFACELAESAFDTYRETPPAERAVFLEAIARNIEAIGDELIVRAMAETGLPRPRLEGERGRTCGQLRLFAKVLRRGDADNVRIDPAQPARQPLPRADLRQRRIALGPVAVFGASNFPLAFSVAGGDTAAALAAGCPVVVKAHSAHPGTSELVGRAIQAAVAECGLPEGVFSLLLGAGNVVGAALVADPRIQAVGFTGSRAGGQALLKIAQARPQPIPVYGELSAINPVFLLPGALEVRAAELGRQFVASLSMGAGQFCTNPGLLLAVESRALDAFVGAAQEALAAVPAQTMLTPGIHRAYLEGSARLAKHGQVVQLGQGLEGCTANACRAGLYTTDATAFLNDPALHEEIFGASALLVRCRDLGELQAVARSLEGQLTATLQLAEADHELVRQLLPVLERKAGRILANGWPTGVEVCDAMVHGGPWPATTDARTTSVGTAAIERFLRPVCYQDLPDALLPAALREANPLGLPRLVDGVPRTA